MYLTKKLFVFVTCFKNVYVLCVFVEISPNYFEEIDDVSDMDHYIIEDDVQSGYDGDVS